MSEVRKAAERLIFGLVGAAVVLVLCVVLVPQLWDKLSPFIVSIPIAAMLQPVIRFLQTRLKMKKSPAVLIPVLLAFSILLVCMWFLLSFGVGQLMEFMNEAPTIINEVVSSMRTAVETLLDEVTTLSPEMESLTRSTLNDTISSMKDWGTATISNLFNFVVNTVTSLPYSLIYANFLLIGLYFIAKNYADIRCWLPGGKKMNQDSNTTKLSLSAIHSLMGYLKVQGTYSLVTFVISWIWLAAFRFHYAGLLALLAMVLEFIPLFGNGVLYIPFAIIAYIGGNAATGTEILILFLLLQLIRRITEPKLMSSSIGISPLQSLIGMFVGLRFGGILGLIGGPVIMAVSVGLVKGPLFASLKDDVITLRAFFGERWKKAS